MQAALPTIKLNDGNVVSQVGLGVFKMEADRGEELIHQAFDVGYRRLDTAAMYENEEMVGQAIASCGLPRDEVQVTTKLWNSDQGYDAALRAFDLSLKKLQLDYIDLYLIHWPSPAQDAYIDTWRALEVLRSQGRVRSVGVSNFLPEHLERLIDETGLAPVLNQIEMHPYFQQNEASRFAQLHGILTEAWSPLGRGAVLDDPIIQTLSQQHGRTPAQVILRWHTQMGNAVIPKSSSPERLRENIDVFDFVLSDTDLQQIADCERAQRTGPDPAVFE